MKDRLELICEPSKWTDLSEIEKMKMQIRAMDSPSFFWNTPELGNNPLWPSQKEILEQFYEKNEDGKRRYSELLFDAGRQGGKTFTASLIVCTELYRLLMLPSPHKHLSLIHI